MKNNMQIILKTLVVSGLLYNVSLFSLPAQAASQPIHLLMGKHHKIVKTGTAHSFFTPSKKKIVHPKVDTADGDSGNGKGPVTYNNGPVEQTPIVYTIFWEPTTLQDGTSTTNSTIPYESNSGISYNGSQRQFLTDLPGSDYYNILTQYYDNSKGHIQANGMTYGGSWVDSSTQDAYLSDGNNGCNNDSSGNCLSDSQIQNEVLNAIDANPTWQIGLNSIFLVYTASGENVCNNASQCTFLTSLQKLAGVKAIGGYHNSVTDDTNTSIVYGAIAFPPIPPTGTTAANIAAATTNVAAHETFEAASDPYPNSTYAGWYGSNGNEIGDICEDEVVNNVQVGSHTYNGLQPMYSNFLTSSGANTGCSIYPGSGQMMSGSVYSNTGSGIHAYNTSDGTSRWSYAPSNATPLADPAEADGKVFSIIDTPTRKLKSINASTGIDTGITYNINGSGTRYFVQVAPYVSGNTVYVGTFDGNGSYLDAFDAACTSSCNPIWSQWLYVSLLNHPTFSGNTMYVPESSNIIEAFDVSGSSPSYLWRKMIYGSIVTPLTVDSSGNIYFGTLNWGQSYITALQPTYSNGYWTISNPWSVNLAGTPGPLTLNNGMLYMTTNCVNNGSGCGTNVIALYTNDGSYAWSAINLSSDSFQTSPVVLAGSSMYFVTGNGAYSYSTANQTQNWHKLSGNSFGEVINTNGNTYVAGSNGVYDLNDSDGSTRAVLTTNASNGFYVSSDVY